MLKAALEGRMKGKDQEEGTDVFGRDKECNGR